MEVALAAGVVGLIPNHTHQADVPASLRPLFASYRHVLSDPQLGSSVVVAAFGFGVLFSYISQSPSIIQGQFGLAAQLFSVVLALDAAAMALSARIRFRTPSTNLKVVLTVQILAPARSVQRQPAPGCLRCKSSRR